MQLLIHTPATASPKSDEARQEDVVKRGGGFAGFWVAVLDEILDAVKSFKNFVSKGVKEPVQPVPVKVVSEPILMQAPIAAPPQSDGVNRAEQFFVPVNPTTVDPTTAAPVPVAQQNQEKREVPAGVVAATPAKDFFALSKIDDKDMQPMQPANVPKTEEIKPAPVPAPVSNTPEPINDQEIESEDVPSNMVIMNRQTAQTGTTNTLAISEGANTATLSSSSSSTSSAVAQTRQASTRSQTSAQTLTPSTTEEQTTETQAATRSSATTTPTATATERCEDGLKERRFFEQDVAGDFNNLKIIDNKYLLMLSFEGRTRNIFAVSVCSGARLECQREDAAVETPPSGLAAACERDIEVDEAIDDRPVSAVNKIGQKLVFVYHDKLYVATGEEVLVAFLEPGNLVREGKIKVGTEVFNVMEEGARGCVDCRLHFSLKDERGNDITELLNDVGMANPEIGPPLRYRSIRMVEDVEAGSVGWIVTMTVTPPDSDRPLKIEKIIPVIYQ